MGRNVWGILSGVREEGGLDLHREAEETQGDTEQQYRGRLYGVSGKERRGEVADILGERCLLLGIQKESLCRVSGGKNESS